MSCGCCGCLCNCSASSSQPTATVEFGAGCNVICTTGDLDGDLVWVNRTQLSNNTCYYRWSLSPTCAWSSGPATVTSFEISCNGITADNWTVNLIAYNNGGTLTGTAATTLCQSAGILTGTIVLDMKLLGVSTCAATITVGP